MARIAVLRESAPAERRVAATPETVKKLITLGASVAVESGAGAGANICDESYAAAGAEVGAAGGVLAGADVVFTVQGAPVDSLRGLAGGARLLQQRDEPVLVNRPGGAAGVHQTHQHGHPRPAVRRR